jgi:ComF family protein
VCGRLLDTGSSYGIICVDCLKNEYYFDRSFSAFIYEKIIAKVIFEFKFFRKRFLAKFLTRFLFIKFKEIEEKIDYIIPVPMHIKKLRVRGYNQSLLLANELSKLVNIPCIYDVLMKQRNTKAQINTSYKARKHNLKSAFCLKEKYKDLIANKTILIVDDVITTGSTINECAKVLKSNGVGRVLVISVAKTQSNISLRRYKDAVRRIKFLQN